MISWYKNLYVGDTAKKKQKKLMQRIGKGKPTPEIWLITLPTNPENNLDLIPADLLLQPGLRASCPMIVGLAGSYGEALQVLEQIVKEGYRDTGDAGIREWLLGRADESR